MKKYVGYVLLAASLVVAYQGFQNSRVDPTTEDLAYDVACDVDAGCLVKGDGPRTVRTDVIQRRYEWRTTVGLVHVVCRRSAIFFGAWHCEPYKGALGPI